MTLGEKIRQLRGELGLSQEEFGKRAGIHPKHVGKYEGNKTIPSADKLRKIAEVLGVSADYLLYDKVPKAGKIEVNDPELLEKFTLIDKVSEKDREIIKTVLDALILKSQVELVVGKPRVHKRGGQDTPGRPGT